MNAVGAPARGPAVAVIVTCYNLGSYLDEAIASVRAQTFQDFSLAIVDDGSTEPETLERLAAHEAAGVRVIRSANRGLPGARNLGIAHTDSRFICSVDADDVLEPELLERSVAMLDSDPSLAFVSHWLRAFGDETWDWTPTRCDFPTLLDTNTINGAALVRREVVAAAGGFDETMRDGCEDWDFWIGVVERGFRGAIIPEFLFRYRRRHQSMSRVMLAGDTHPQLYRRIAEKHAAAFREHLPALLLRRERDAAHMRGQILDLELERTRWLLPALATQRDDVAVLERRVERGQHWQALSDEAMHLQEDVKALEADVRRSEALRATADAALAEAESQQRTIEVQLAEVRGSLARAEQAVASAQDALSAKDAALADLEARRAAAEQETAMARAAEADRTRERDGASAQAYAHDAHASRAEAMLAGMKNSWSWRLTAPLRGIGAAFRKPGSGA